MTDDTNDAYKGPERRSGKDRRVNSDRRDMIRFEPSKIERRSGKDRRKIGEDMWERRDI